MKKFIFILLASLNLIFSPSQAALKPASVSFPAKQENTVYITKTGHKYHRENCRYLRQSKIQTTKKQALAQGLTACSICRP